MNRVILCGNLGGDVDVQTSKGTTFAHLSLALNEFVPLGEGEFERRVVWVRVTAFGSLARSLRTLGKGSKVLVEGRLKQAVYQKDDVRFQYVEVVAEKVEFQLVKPRADAAGEAAGEAPADEPTTVREAGADDDDIPF